MSLIKVIIGSTRTNRFGEQPAKWIMDLTKEYPDHTFELIDLKEINLPFMDEPNPPLAGDYTLPHTKAWAQIVDAADGFIVVTPEYNHGAPAVLKNALDILAKEWFYKPISFVNYGAKAGGARAVEQLRATSIWLRMIPLPDEVSITNYWGQLDGNGKLQPTEDQTADAKRLIENSIFWATELKPIREKKLAA